MTEGGLSTAQTLAISNSQLSPNDASIGRRRNSLVADVSFENTSQRTERRGSLNSQLLSQSHAKFPVEEVAATPQRTNLEIKSPALLTRRMSKSFSNLVAFNSMKQDSAPQPAAPLTTRSRRGSAAGSSDVNNVTDQDHQTPRKATENIRKNSIRREKSADPRADKTSMQDIQRGDGKSEVNLHREKSQDKSGVEQEIDPKLPAKLGRLSQNISAITDKTRVAREELQRMTEITKELRNQCNLQELECNNLETDQVKVKEEIDNVSKRMESLLSEKKRVELRLEQLRLENAKLEEFLENHKRSGPV